MLYYLKEKKQINIHYSIRGREREGSALAQALGGFDGALGCCCNVLLPGKMLTTPCAPVNYACKGDMLSSGQHSGTSHQSVISGCSAGP